MKTVSTRKIASEIAPAINKVVSSDSRPPALFLPKNFVTLSYINVPGTRSIIPEIKNSDVGALAIRALI